MDEELLAYGLILLGLFVIAWGRAQFSKKDGRTKTGYKDNVLPKPGKGFLLIIIGAFFVLIGIVGLSPD